MRITLEAPKKAEADFRLDRACGHEKCMQCGRCTASCPAAFEYGDYRPREVLRQLQLGNRAALNDILWRCGQCYSCAARCPRNNSAGTAILALREAAISAGRTPPGIKHVASVLRKNL